MSYPSLNMNTCIVALGHTVQKPNKWEEPHILAVNPKYMLHFSQAESF